VPRLVVQQFATTLKKLGLFHPLEHGDKLAAIDKLAPALKLSF
jgi:hypothetical protein